MTNTTSRPPKLGSVVPGPWRSKYAVSEQTLAVNMAQSAAANDIDSDDGVVEAIDAVVTSYEDDDIINDGSIRGFWAWVWSGLDRFEQRDVAKRAEALLEAHRNGTYGGKTDVFEMFDGQR